MVMPYAILIIYLPIFNAGFTCGSTDRGYKPNITQERFLLFEDREDQYPEFLFHK